VIAIIWPMSLPAPDPPDPCAPSAPPAAPPAPRAAAPRRGFGRRLAGLLLAGALPPLAGPARATPGEVPIGQPLRDAPLRGLNGPSRRLADYRGKPLIINVWASWCGPCRAEMASLERLAWSPRAVPFAIIGISTDDYPEKALALLTGTNATISHFIDSQLQLENLLGASRLPLTVLVDADFRVVDKVYGSQEWDGAPARQRILKAFGASAAKTAAWAGPAPQRAK